MTKHQCQQAARPENERLPSPHESILSVCRGMGDFQAVLAEVAVLLAAGCNSGPRNSSAADRLEIARLKSELAAERQKVTQLERDLVSTISAKWFRKVLASTVAITGLVHFSAGGKAVGVDGLTRRLRDDFGIQTTEKTLSDLLKEAFEVEGIGLRAPSDNSGDGPDADRWPWGSYTTPALDHLEAAIRRHWVNYDPSDNTTAPRKADVINWLVENCGDTKTTAEAIATIARDPALRTGPR